MIFDFDWFDEFDLFDISIAGGLSEEIADEERERRKIEDDWNKDQEGDELYCEE